MLKINRRNLCLYPIAVVVLIMLFIMTLFVAIPKINAEAAEKEILQIDGTEYVSTKTYLDNSSIYQLKKSRQQTLFKNNRISDFSSELGLTSNEYNMLSQDVKYEIENGESIYIQEAIVEVASDVLEPIQYEIDNQNILNAYTTIPDYDSSNGYLKFRFTIVDTGEFFENKNSNGVVVDRNRILYFNVEAEWKKLPLQRRDDYFAFAIPGDFRVIESSRGGTSWEYFLDPANQQQGIPASGTQYGYEKDGSWWDGLLDGGYRFTNKSSEPNTNRDVMTFDLPNKTNFYRPTGRVNCNYGYRVEEKGDGSAFNMYTVYGHDQTVFGAKAPSISINGVNIELGGDHKEYAHMLYNIVV